MMWSHWDLGTVLGAGGGKGSLDGIADLVFESLVSKHKMTERYVNYARELS